ncbi:MAG: hypothetical protein KJ804_12240 [Proteobacteria bacterium]|nr:hypothetical protein [Pseudomonadota bacterium]
MSQASSQTNFWELFIRLEFNETERPKEGWKVLERTPQGLKEITTRRNKVVKFKQIKDLFAWIKENRTGYAINVDCFDYGGRLTLRQ